MMLEVFDLIRTTNQYEFRARFQEHIGLWIHNILPSFVFISNDGTPSFLSQIQFAYLLCATIGTNLIKRDLLYLIAVLISGDR